MLGSLAISIYIVEILSNIKVVIFIPLLVSAIALFISIMIYGAMSCDGEEDNGLFIMVKRLIKPLIISILACGIIFTVIPSKATMYIMLGLNATDKIMNIENVSDIGKKTIELLNKKLDSELKEYIELEEENRGKSDLSAPK